MGSSHRPTRRDDEDAEGANGGVRRGRTRDRDGHDRGASGSDDRARDTAGRDRPSGRGRDRSRSRSRSRSRDRKRRARRGRRRSGSHSRGEGASRRRTRGARGSFSEHGAEKDEEAPKKKEEAAKEEAEEATRDEGMGAGDEKMRDGEEEAERGAGVGNEEEIAKTANGRGARRRSRSRGRRRRDRDYRSRSRSRDRRSGKRSRRKRRRRRSSSSSSSYSSSSDGGSYSSSSSSSRSRSRRRKSKRSKRRSKKSKRDKKDAGYGANAIGNGSAEEVARQQAAMQAMQAQLALAQQWVAQQQAVSASSNRNQDTRRQRELYVGNLAMNLVTPEIVAEVFNSALSSLSDDGLAPVVNVSMSMDGKFAFVEMRTEPLSDAAMHLDGVELCGRAMRVGRPKGWVPPPVDTAAAAPPNASTARPDTTQTGGPEAGVPGSSLGGDTPGGAAGMADETARVAHVMHALDPAMTAMTQKVHGHGGSATTTKNAYLDGMAPNTFEIPPNTQFPPTPLGVPVQVLVRRCLLLDNMVPARELGKEAEREEFKEDVREECAKCGIIDDMVVPHPPRDAVVENQPGRCYVKFQAAFSARAAREMLNGRVFDGRTVAASLASDAEFDRAAAGEWLPPRPPPGDPSLCGILRVRRMPPEATKADLVNFFYGMGVTEEKIKIIVQGLDNVSTGEAFVEFSGEEANIQQALMKDKAVLGTKPIEIFQSSLDEVQRVVAMGRAMV